jgi:hypothetical protein
MGRELKYDRASMTKTVIKHIKDLTVKGNYVKLTIKDIKALLETTQHQALCILQSLRDQANIEATLDIDGRGSAKTKSYLYRYVEKARSIIEEDKADDKFKFLTISEVNTVIKQLGKSNSSLEMSLKILNTLSIKGAKGGFIQYLNILSDLLVLTHSQVRLYISMLNREGFLELNECDKNLVMINILNGSKPNTEEYKEDVLDPVRVVIEKPEVKVEVKEPIKSVVITESEIDVNNAISEVIIKNVKDFTGFIGDFQEFMSSMVNQIEAKYTVNTEELEELKAKNANKDLELEKGNAVLERYQIENHGLKDIAAQLGTDLKSANKLVYATNKAHQDVLEFMNERFEIVIAEITNTMCEYAQTPEWKLNASAKARFQNVVVSAITTAVQDILKRNKSGNKE